MNSFKLKCMYLKRWILLGYFTAIANNIINAINQSRRTILILTPRYVQSEFTRFEYQVAQHEMLKKKHRIIPILLEDISSEKDAMDPNLKQIIKSVTYLEYPTDSDEKIEKKINGFWTKLELSLPKKKSRGEWNNSSSENGISSASDDNHYKSSNSSTSSSVDSGINSDSNNIKVELSPMDNMAYVYSEDEKSDINRYTELNKGVSDTNPYTSPMDNMAYVYSEDEKSDINRYTELNKGVSDTNPYTNLIQSQDSGIYTDLPELPDDSDVYTEIRNHSDVKINIPNNEPSHDNDSDVFSNDSNYVSTITEDTRC